MVNFQSKMLLLPLSKADLAVDLQEILIPCICTVNAAQGTPAPISLQWGYFATFPPCSFDMGGDASPKRLVLP